MPSQDNPLVGALETQQKEDDLRFELLTAKIDVLKETIQTLADQQKQLSQEITDIQEELQEITAGIAVSYPVQ